MFHRRRLGVKEANAIEDIISYEMKKERGDPTADKLAYDAAWLVVERRQNKPTQVPTQQQHVSAEHNPESREPVFNHMFGYIVTSTNTSSAEPAQVTHSLKLLAYLILGFLGWLAFASIWHVFS